MTTTTGMGRDALLQFMRTHLIGPHRSDDDNDASRELIPDDPLERYTAGALYPPYAIADIALEGEEFDGRGGGDTDGATDGPADDPISLASQRMPSSMGLSFRIRGDRVVIDLTAGSYSPFPTGGWRREPHASTTVVDAAGGRRQDIDVLDGRATLVVVMRPMRGGHLVTASVVCGGAREGHGRPAASECLFQVEMIATPDAGAVAYPAPAGLRLEEEDEELELQYHQLRPYAVGHGIAADWDDPEDGVTRCVRTATIPAFEVPQMRPTGLDGPVLELRRLAGAADGETLAAMLDPLADAYAAWIDRIAADTAVPAHLSAASARIIARLRTAADRISAGIELLRSDPDVRLAFQLANGVIADSMARGRGVAEQRRTRDTGHVDDVLDTRLKARWHPFQVAFQLCALPSLVEPGHPDRRLVDLLWFPTGGGKTEAYLGLAAMTIILRRLTGGGAGVAVLTRYTLRLLTTQQFQRTATMIAALELLRRARNDLGGEPIEVGLWVGAKVTPNNHEQAKERLHELLEEEEPTPAFGIDACPWCATYLAPQRRSIDRADYGFDASDPGDFRIHCPSADCPFHKRIPVQVVDQILYEQPSDFIVATVDKFAQVALNPRAARLLGVGTGGGPPSLVIQDELHLLAGPLGTIVGVYETAFIELMRRHGAIPKVVASTATIRRAGDQARGIFGGDVAVFPPPGLRSTDSFFSTIDRDRPGRLYAGLMSQMHSPTFATAHAAAVLRQGSEDLALTDGEKRSYRTLVAYHNSLRELGKSVTLARDDIPTRTRVYNPDHHAGLDPSKVAELTSNVGSAQLTGTLGRLHAHPDDDDGIQFLACTNMLSVGVDIPRLGLMLVNGQPKTTSEYIQSTSRVGRGDIPGLVVAQYSPTKPRDRSHYEGFRGYHQSLYRWVEPTSVTPFALPARNRALHAALVIMVRNLLPGLAADDAAGSFRRDVAGLDDIVDGLVGHIRRVDDSEADDARRHLEDLIDQWHDRAVSSGADLRYFSYRPDRRRQYLLVQFNSRWAGWETLNSMRNVDVECLVRIPGSTANA